jgi:hypothetical protein
MCIRQAQVIASALNLLASAGLGALVSIFRAEY